MAKKYKLLQDINSVDLVAKAGAVGIVSQGENDSIPKVWFDEGRFFYRLSKVVESPEWFEEVKEVERIEVKIERMGHHDPRIKPLEFVVYPSHGVAEWQLPLIKKAIEGVLNENVKSFVWNSETVMELIAFAIKHNYLPHDPINLIKDFTNGKTIDSNQKSESRKDCRVPLFTTEDGVQIFAFDPYWFVNVGSGFPNTIYWSAMRRCADITNQEGKMIKTFSCESAAKGYIMLHKPFLSISDVMKVCEEIKWDNNPYKDEDDNYVVYVSLLKDRLINLLKK